MWYHIHGLSIFYSIFSFWNGLSDRVDFGRLNIVVKLLPFFMGHILPFELFPLFHSHDGFWKWVTELITLRCTCPFPHEPQQIPPFDRCIQQTSEIPSLSFACVWWMSGRWAVIGYALKPQPCRKGYLSSMDPYQILSQLLGIRFRFVLGIFSSGVTSWLRYWSVCSNVECLRLIGRRDFQLIGRG
jgi:hypothetical protein